MALCHVPVLVVNTKRVAFSVPADNQRLHPIVQSNCAPFALVLYSPFSRQTTRRLGRRQTDFLLRPERAGANSPREGWSAS